MVPLEQGVSEALLEREVRSDLTDYKDLRVVQELQDQMDQRGQLELKVPSERSVLRVLWECQEREGSPEPQDQREMREVQATPGLKEKQELMDKGDWLVLWDLQDQVDLMERRENLDLQDQPADGAPEESLVQLESPVPLVLLDSLDLLVLMASLE